MRGVPGSPGEGEGRAVSWRRGRDWGTRERGVGRSPPGQEPTCHCVNGGESSLHCPPDVIQEALELWFGPPSSAPSLFWTAPPVSWSPALTCCCWSPLHRTRSLSQLALLFPLLRKLFLPLLPDQDSSSFRCLLRTLPNGVSTLL